MIRWPAASLALVILLAGCTRLGTPPPSRDTGTDGSLDGSLQQDQLSGEKVLLPDGRLVAAPDRLDPIELFVEQPRTVELVITRDDGLALPVLTFSSDAAWISASFAPASGATSTTLSLTLDPALAGRGPHAASGIVYAPGGGVSPVSVSLEVFVLAEIYRSVEPGRTTPLATGTDNTLTLSGLIADFAQPLPLQVGVGDAIQYDSTGDTQPDALAFIQERISARRYAVRNAAGDAARPTGPTQSWSLLRAYTSLADAVSGKENAGFSAVVRDFDQWSGGRDLVAANERWNIACYSGAVDTTRARISASWITGPLTSLKVFTPVHANQVGVSQRHQGVWTETAYRLEWVTNGGEVIGIEADHVWVEGLQIRGIAGTSSFRGIWVIYNGPAAQIRLSSNLIRGEGWPSSLPLSRGIQILQPESTGRISLWNNIVYDLGSSNSSSLLVEQTSVTIVAYNNSFIHGKASMVEPAQVLARNNVALNGFYGSYLAGSSHNATGYSDRTAGSPAIVLASRDVLDYFYGNGDYRLNAAAPRAADLIDSGVDLSADPELAVRDDLVGTSRPRGFGFDVGAYELIP